MDWSFRTTQELEKGHKCREVDCEEPILARVTTVVRELARCRLYLVRVQEVRWNKEGTVRAEGYTLLYWEGNENRHLGRGFLQERIVLPVKTVEFVSDRM